MEQILKAWQCPADDERDSLIRAAYRRLESSPPEETARAILAAQPSRKASLVFDSRYLHVPECSEWEKSFQAEWTRLLPASLPVTVENPAQSNPNQLNVDLLKSTPLLKSTALVGPSRTLGNNKSVYDEEEPPPFQASNKRWRFTTELTDEEPPHSRHQVPHFSTAKSKYQQSMNQGVNNRQQPAPSSSRPFKPPSRLKQQQPGRMEAPQRAYSGGNPSSSSFVRAPVHSAQQQQPPPPHPEANSEENVHPKLKGIDPQLVERIENEILESGQPVTFDDIAGLTFAKQCIEEMVVWPVTKPELYTGLRQLPKGLLLFGPPGTGKTVLGKAIAHQCNATFFSISASSLTSKWIGEGEKLVRALFAVASVKQPSVVFIDEVDSLLTQRSSDENEASRRIKTEFLVQFDGAATGQDDVVLIIGATNRPQELDEAARRRFVRRLYVPLPDLETRQQLLGHLLGKNENCMTSDDIEAVATLTDGYSGADVTNLAREASMRPLREVMRDPQLRKQQQPSLHHNCNMKDMIRPICRQDFDAALKSVKASVSGKDLAGYERWNEEFGTQAYQD